MLIVGHGAEMVKFMSATGSWFSRRSRIPAMAAIAAFAASVCLTATMSAWLPLSEVSSSADSIVDVVTGTGRWEDALLPGAAKSRYGFSGASNKAIVTNAFLGTDGRTVMGWVYIDPGATDVTIFRSADSWELSFSSKGKATVHVSSTPLAKFVTFLRHGMWHHVVLAHRTQETVHGNAIVLQIDGTEVPLDWTYNYTYGVWNPLPQELHLNPDNNAKLVLRDVRVYPYGLSSPDLQALTQRAMESFGGAYAGEMWYRGCFRFSQRDAQAHGWQYKGSGHTLATCRAACGSRWVVGLTKVTPKHPTWFPPKPGVADDTTLCYCRFLDPSESQEVDAGRCGLPAGAETDPELPSRAGRPGYISAYSTFATRPMVDLCGAQHTTTDPDNINIGAMPSGWVTHQNGQCEFRWPGAIWTALGYFTVTPAFMPGTIDFHMQHSAAALGAANAQKILAYYHPSIAIAELSLEFTDGGKLMLSFNDPNNAASVTTTTALVSAVWYHITITVSTEREVKLWVDGVVVGRIAPGWFSAIASSTDGQVGAWYFGSLGGGALANQFLGEMKDVRMYREAWPDARIVQSHRGVYRHFCSNGEMSDMSVFAAPTVARGSAAIAVEPSLRARLPTGLRATHTSDGEASVCDLKDAAIEIETPTPLRFPFTVSAWVRWLECPPEEEAEVSALFGWGHAGDALAYYFAMQPVGGGSTVIGVGGAGHVVPIDSWRCDDPDHAWRHVTYAVSSDGELSVYVDGGFILRERFPMPNATDGGEASFVQRIGGRPITEGGQAGSFPAGSGSTFQAVDVKLYHRALTAGEAVMEAASDSVLGQWCTAGVHPGNAADPEWAPWRDHSGYSHLSTVSQGVTFGKDDGEERYYCEVDRDFTYGAHLQGGYYEKQGCITIPQFVVRPEEFTLMGWVKIVGSCDGSAGAEDETDPIGAVFGWYGLGVHSALRIRRHVEYREVDAAGRVYIARPQRLASHDLCDGRWHHVAVTVDRHHTVGLYVDGAYATIWEKFPTDEHTSVRDFRPMYPDLTGPGVFTHSAVGCWDEAPVAPRTEATPPKLQVKDVKVLARVVEAGELGHAHAQHAVLVKTCDGGVVDSSQWRRPLTVSNVASAFDGARGYATCRFTSAAAGSVAITEGVMDRPHALSVAFWARRLNPAGAPCAARDDGAWVTLATEDGSYLTVQGGGHSPRVAEGHLDGAVNASSNTIVFRACNETSCAEQTGWVQSFRTAECVPFTPPCGGAQTEWVVYRFNDGRRENATEYVGDFSHVNATYYNTSACADGDAVRGDTWQCGHCSSGLRYVGRNSLPCDVQPHDLDASFPEAMACDYSWHHVVAVLPSTRKDVHLYVDGLKVVPEGNLDDVESFFPVSPTTSVVLGQRWDPTVGAFAGAIEADIGDFHMFNRALDLRAVEEVAGCEMQWRSGAGECLAGYEEHEGLALDQCKDVCLNTTGCHVLQFPLPDMDYGCRIQVRNPDAPPLCGAAPTHSQTTLYFPSWTCPRDGLAAKWCAAGIVHDTSDYGHPSSSATGVTAVPDGGCRFDGATSGFEVLASDALSNDAVVQPPKAFTIAAWVRPAQACGSLASGAAPNASHPGDAGDTFFASWGDVDTASFQVLGLDPVGRVFFETGVGASRSRTTVPVSMCSEKAAVAEEKTPFRHVALTMTHTKLLSLYVDGEYVAWVFGAHEWVAGRRLDIGRGIAGDRGVTGVVESLRVYYTPLPPKMIRALASSRGSKMGRWCAGWTHDVSGANRHPSVVSNVTMVDDVDLKGPVCHFGGGNAFLGWDSNAPLRGQTMLVQANLKLASCVDGIHPVVSWGGVPTRGAMLFFRISGADKTLAFEESTVRGGVGEEQHSAVSVTSVQLVCDTNWHHVALSITPEGARIFFDGVDVTAAGDPVRFPSPPFLRGNAPIGNHLRVGAGVLVSTAPACPTGTTACGTKCFRAVPSTYGTGYAQAASYCQRLVDGLPGFTASVAIARSVEDEACMDPHIPRDNDYHVRSGTWVGATSRAGYWAYDVAEHNGTEVRYFPQGHVPHMDDANDTGKCLYTSHGDHGVGQSQRYFAAECEETHLKFAVCELAYMDRFAGSMENVEIAFEELPPVSAPGSPQYAAADLQQRVAYTAPVVTPPHVCNITSIHPAPDVNNVLTLLAPDTMAHTDAHWWVTGASLAHCVLVLTPADGATLDAVTLPIRKIGVAGPHVEAGVVHVSSEAFVQIPKDVKLEVVAKTARDTADLTASGIYFVLKSLPNVATEHHTARSTRVTFSRFTNWDAFADAEVAAATNGTCATTVSSAKIIHAEAALPSIPVLGGVYPLCIRFRPDDPFAPLGADVHIVGECSGRGVYVVATGDCRCVNDEHRGAWGGPKCTDCAPGFYGENCTRECSDSHCSYRGKCSDDGDCICELGFFGQRCEHALACNALRDVTSVERMGTLQRFRLWGPAGLYDDTRSVALTKSGLPSFLPDGVIYLASGSSLSTPVQLTFGTLMLWVRNLRDITDTTSLSLLCISTHLCIRIGAGKFQLVVGGESLTSNTTAMSFSPTQWVHVAVTFGDPSNPLQLFVNGVREAVGATVPAPTIPQCVINVGCDMEIGGNQAMDVRDVRTSLDYATEADAAQVWREGVTTEQGTDCPGKCHADHNAGSGTLAVFNLQSSLRDEVEKTYEAKLVGGRRLEEHALQGGALELEGDSFLQTDIFVPTDRWAVTAWFRLGNTSSANPGCLYSAATQRPTAPPADTSFLLAHRTFDGTSYHDSADPIFSTGFGDTWTISLWAKHTAVACTIYNRGDVVKFAFTGTAYRVTWKGNYIEVDIPAGFDHEVYHHFVFVVHGFRMWFWIDGAMDGPFVSSSWAQPAPDLSASPLRIGEGVVGGVKEMRVYRRALLQNEIDALRASGVAGVNHEVCIVGGVPKATVYHPNGQTWTSSNTAAMQPFEWHHIAHVFSYTHHYLYVDGRVASTTMRNSFPSAAHPTLYAGAGGQTLQDQSHYFFVGELTDLRVFSRDITDAELRRVWASRNEGPTLAAADDRPTTVSLAGGLQVKRFPK